MMKVGHWSKHVKDTFTQIMDWFNLICAVMGLCEHINDAFGCVVSGGCQLLVDSDSGGWWQLIVFGDHTVDSITI